MALSAVRANNSANRPNTTDFSAVTTAYASKNLQEKFQATPEGEVFTLPENVMVAPWIGENGRKNWTLYLQADLDLEQSKSSRIAQTLSR